jgi:hypothetical protein
VVIQMLKEKELELLETLKLANDMNLKKFRDLQSNQIYGEIEGKEIKIKDASGGHCELNYIAGGMKQAVRQGYNKLVYPFIDSSKTNNGVTFSDLGNGIVVANGNATADAYFNLSRPTIQPGAYLYTIDVIGSTTTFYAKFGTQIITNKATLNISEEFTPTESYLCVKKGTSVKNLIFKPMLIEDTIEKSFEQYGKMPSLDYPSEIEGTEAYNKFYVVNSKTEEAGIKVKKINGSSLTFTGTTNGVFYYELMNFNSLVLSKKMYFKKFGNFTGGKVLISYIKNGETSISYHNLDWETNKDKSFEVGTTIIALYIQQPESNIKIEGKLEILYTEYENKDKEFLPYNVVQTEIRNKNHFDIGSNNNEWSSFSDNGSKLTNLFGIPSTVDMTILNDKVSIDRYDTKNYMWIGKRIFIEKNTDYIITRKHSLPMEIRGFYTLNINSAGTKITVSNQEFNSGDFPYYFVVFYPKESGEYIEDFQIIEKSADLNYIKHQNQKYQLSLGDRILYGDDNSRDYFDVEIDKELYNKTGYKKISNLKLVKNWTKYVFKGEEKIFFSIVQGDYFLAQYKFPLQKRETLVYSNKFVYKTIWGIANSREGINSAYNEDSIIQMKVLSSRLPEVSNNGFQQFLKEKNIYVIYQLNVPEEELIVDSLLISQIEEMINNIEVYEEETNINSDCYLKLKYCKSLQKYIENKIKEVSLNE